MAEAYTSWKSAGGNNADHIGGNGYEFSYVDETGYNKNPFRSITGRCFATKRKRATTVLFPLCRKAMIF